MNETEEKQSKGMPIWGMLALIVVLIVSVKLVFGGLDAVLPHLENPYEVMDANTGEKSDWSLSIGPVERNSPGEEWIGKCPDGEGFHGFMDTAPDRWAAAIYLPQVEQKLANSNVSLEVREGEGGSVLVVYVSTVGLQQEEDPEEQILWLTAPEGKTWPNQLSVVLNGAELEQASLCIRNAGQMFWAD